MSEASRICHQCGYQPVTSTEEVCPRDGRYLISLKDHRKRPHDQLLGSLLGGRYPLLGVIGEGGMGTVYRSMQSPLRRPVAIKVVLPGMTLDGEGRQRFLREAETLGRLVHPCVVTLFDFGIEPDSTLYMVMELVSGVTLHAALRQGGLTTRQVVTMGLDVLDALALAHEQGVIHRDLKPANIMLVPTSSAGQRQYRTKLLDFGIARLVGGSAHRLTKVGSILGTPDYMAPEQVAGRELDGRADVCALAAVLYECLAGQPPFASGDFVQTLERRIRNEPPPLPTHPWISRPLDPVLRRAMALRREARHGSASEFARALAQVSLGPEADRPIPPTQQPAPPADQAPPAAEQGDQPQPQAGLAGPLPALPAAAPIAGPGPEDKTTPRSLKHLRQAAAASEASPETPRPTAQPASQEQQPHEELDTEPPPARRGHRLTLLVVVGLILLLIGEAAVLLYRTHGSAPADVTDADAVCTDLELTARVFPDSERADLGRPGPAGAEIQARADAGRVPRLGITSHRLSTTPVPAQVFDHQSQLLGTTPFTWSSNRRGGSRTYRLVAPGYAEQTILLPLDGRRHEEPVRLVPLPPPPPPPPSIPPNTPATLEIISSVAGATFHLDDRPLGQAPSSGIIRIAPQQDHRLKVIFPRPTPVWERTIRLLPGQHQMVRAEPR